MFFCYNLRHVCTEAVHIVRGWMVSSVGGLYHVLCILSSSQWNRFGNSVLHESCPVSTPTNVHISKLFVTLLLKRTLLVVNGLAMYYFRQVLQSYFAILITARRAPIKIPGYLPLCYVLLSLRHLVIFLCCPCYSFCSLYPLNILPMQATSYMCSVNRGIIHRLRKI